MIRKTHCVNGHLRTSENVDKNGSCKICKTIRSANWRKANPEQMRQYSRNWSKNNRDYNLERAKIYRLDNPEKVKNTRLKSRYGITTDQFEQMLIAQCNKCAICEVLFDNDNKPKIDHKHDETEQVRGLLCHKCNSAIGYFGEDINSLKNAIKYLEDNGSNYYYTRSGI